MATDDSSVAVYSLASGKGFGSFLSIQVKSQEAALNVYPSLSHGHRECKSRVVETVAEIPS